MFLVAKKLSSELLFGLLRIMMVFGGEVVGFMYFLILSGLCFL